jgi:ribose/xylose/arabinose/galactoside ABC-type transport system permease subunit
MAWWKRLLIAQESGLVLVIALMMTLLTIFSGTKPVRDRIEVPQDVTIIAPEGPVMRATIQGVERTFDTRDGWTLDQRPAGSFFVRETTANKFLNLANLMDVLVFASFVAIMAVGITAVIAMGGIDLSIGSIYALAALMGAIALRYNFAEGLPTPVLLGSNSLWWVGVVAGITLLGAGFMFKVAGRAHATTPAGQGRFNPRAFAQAFVFAGVGVMAVVGWQVLAQMRDAGSASTARSELPLIYSLPLALLVCGSVGALAGWLNGTMVVSLKVHPFIITLGTMAAYRGLVAIPTQAQSVGSFPESLREFVKWSELGVTPVPAIVTLLVGLAGYFVLRYTVLGRRVYAIGGNETAAVYAGVPVGRVKVIVYTLMGLLAGLSACVYLGYFGAAETNAGNGYELKAIAAAVIGGASLSGGRGSALGAILGAVLVGLIENGILLLGIDQNYNQIILGGAIITAVVLDQVKSRLLPQGR